MIFARIALVVALLAVPLVATAQPGAHPEAKSAASVPGLPSGDGTLTVRVILASDGSPLPDVDVAVYSLSPDGQPGLGSGRTLADGTFVFEALSRAPGITYLAGANYQGIPFGARVAFEEGASEQHAVLEVIEATTDGPPLRVLETRIQLEWLGGLVHVQVSHLLRNDGDRVVRIPAAERTETDAPFVAQLPNDFVEFAQAPSGFAEGIERDGRTLRFFGPVYPGQQQVRYQYTLAIPEDAADAAMAIRAVQPFGTGKLVIAVPEGGPKPVGRGLEPTGSATEDGRELATYTLPPVAAGGELALSIGVPESREDRDAVRLTRADYWLDHDDAAVSVRAQIQLEVAPGPRVFAPPGKRLLHIDLPPNATLDGVSAEAERFGLVVAPEGGLDLVGPVPPGQSSIDFGFSAPAQDGVIDVALQLDRDLPVLNVLVADNGVVIEGDRLHRRRPFRQGTRNYLHRRAFQLAGDERVDIRLRALETRGESSRLAAVGILLLGAAAAAFLAAPLRTRREDDPSAETIPEARHARDRVYAAIRDLDYDLETGKVDEADHLTMRAELRAEAVELLRVERGEAASADPPAMPAATPELGAHCPQCGGVLAASWRFCSHCGHALARDEAPDGAEDQQSGEQRVGGSERGADGA